MEKEVIHHNDIFYRIDNYKAKINKNVKVNEINYDSLEAKLYKLIRNKYNISPLVN